MPCFRPINAWRSSVFNPSGKRGISFDIKTANVDMPITLPCGQCIGCRLERSRQWAIRCVHEASLHERNSFITLTYDDDHLPPGETLVKKDFQDFMKRLRRGFDGKIRYFHCGEYGENLGRPHYHACLFGYDPPDKRLWRANPTGDLYVSDSLNETWGQGYCIIGSVTFESAAYVARYIAKKITGDQADVHYQGKQPEYITMSRRPGIARSWYDQWKGDCYPSDSVVMRGKEFKPPKYYDRQLEVDNPELYRKTKAIRKANSPDPCDPEFGSTRMAVKEKVQLLNLETLNRSYENEN